MTLGFPRVSSMMTQRFTILRKRSFVMPRSSVPPRTRSTSPAWLRRLASIRTNQHHETNPDSRNRLRQKDQVTNTRVIGWHADSAGAHPPSAATKRNLGKARSEATLVATVIPSKISRYHPFPVILNPFFLSAIQASPFIPRPPVPKRAL